MTGMSCWTQLVPPPPPRTHTPHPSPPPPSGRQSPQPFDPLIPQLLNSHFNGTTGSIRLRMRYEHGALLLHHGECFVYVADVACRPTRWP